MQAFPNRIQRIIDEGYSFKFGDYISRGFDIMNKNVGLFIGFFLIFMIISSVGGLIPIVGQLAVSLIINPCLMVGFYFACKDTEDGHNLQFERFFDGFKHWKELTLVGLIQVAIILVPLSLVGVSAFVLVDLFSPGANQANNPLLFLLPLIVIIPVIYIFIAWQFAPFLVVFEKMSPWAALEASRKIISKTWFSYLGFGIVVGIIMMLGIIAVFIGLIYTVPAGMAMLYSCYSDIVGFAKEDGEMDILDHFIDD